MNEGAISDYYDYVNYRGLPEHMQSTAREYVELGMPPGGFFYAVLCNQLVEAFGKADQINRASMYMWAEWLYNEAPQNCWGTPEKIKGWIEQYRVRRNSVPD